MSKLITCSTYVGTAFICLAIGFLIGRGSVASPTATRPSAETRNQAGLPNVDDLGYGFTIAIDSPDIKLVDWQTYIGDDGYLYANSEIRQAADTEEIAQLLLSWRLYDADANLIGAEEFPNIGFRLRPGRVSRDGVRTFVEADAIDHYAIEIEVMR